MYWKDPDNNNDLTKLIEFLAQRYKDSPNVIYGFGAEPDIPSAEFDRWFNKQLQLANIVRKHNPKALLLITGTDQYKLSGFIDKPFPLDNIIYQTGGYISSHDEGFRQRLQNPEFLKQRYQSFVHKLAEKYPIMLGEFGGNVSEDFSSDIDLQSIREILEIIKPKGIHYMGYRLSAYTDGDRLSLFDITGTLSIRGKLFSEYFSK